VERVASENQDSDNRYPDDETNLHNQRLHAVATSGNPVHEFLVVRDGRHRGLAVKRLG
jgi:hypothetical protein